MIDAAFRTFLRAGDGVILPTPSWPVYGRRLGALEAAITEVPLKVDERSYSYAVERTLAAITPQTKMVVICSPNNPTGNTLSARDARRIAETGRVVLLDLAYGDFASGDDLAALVHEYENVLAAFTFSKAYGLAGLRLGYILGAPRMMDYVDRFLVPGGSVSSVALAAGLAALADEAYHRIQVERIIAERERAIAAARACGLRAFDSHGNFFVIDASGFPDGAKGFVEAVLKHSVVIRAMNDSLARITVGTREENEVLIGALRAIRESYHLEPPEGRRRAS